MSPPSALRAAPSTATPVGAERCLHCGSPTEGRSAYCCDGCEALHHLLTDGGLDRYYDLGGDRRRPTAAAPSDAYLELLEGRVRDATGLVRIDADLQGIHCAACVWLVEKLFRRLPGAHAILVNPGRGTLALTVGADFPVRAFAADLTACGYTLGPAGAAKAAAGDDLRLRMGVCIALAMNAMLFAISRYAGLAGDSVASFFDALGFGLASLSVFVGAPTFVRAAIAALRRGALHLDVPISLGIVTAYGSSAWSFFQGRQALYFDTLSVFIALMLVGRWLRERAIGQARAQILEADPSDGILVRRLRPGLAAEIVPAKEIRAGDDLLLASGDVVPVAAELVGARAELSLDWITGESEPVAFEPGASVPAGAFAAPGSAVRVRATEDFAGSGLRSLLLAPPRGDQETPGFWHWIGTAYVGAVLAVATVAGVAWWLVTRDFGRTSDVLTSIFIVTCPCALGIAVPLTYDLFHAKLARAGVRVRSSSLLDRARLVRHVAFDKTGTLTTGELEIANPGALDALDEPSRAALAWLALHTSHPKAVAVRRAADRRGLHAAALDAPVDEVPARGVRTTLDGHEYRLGRGDFVVEGGSPADFDFGRDGERLAAFDVREQPRLDAAREISALEAEGYGVSIRSGDAEDRVLAMARAVGVAPANAEGGLSPHAKAERLGALGAATLFVGDGINDAPAFRAAACSGTPAVDRPFVPARTDFFLVGAGLGGVRAVLREARALHRAVLVNLGLAFTYNALSLSLAVAGRLSPLLCAILMPASSLTAIALSLWASRTRAPAPALAPTTVPQTA